jgi:hypothetical protein
MAPTRGAATDYDIDTDYDIENGDIENGDIENGDIENGTHKGCRYMIYGRAFVAAPLVGAIKPLKSQDGTQETSAVYSTTTRPFKGCTGRLV